VPSRRFTNVDLTELLRTLVEVYQPMAEEREQRFTADVASGLTVWGDRELLAQMVANVIENAMKHSPMRASIALRTIPSAASIAVTVVDTGPGIPAADRDRVFQRFYRLEGSRSTPGSGLGLSLVEAIAVLHRVSIELTDNNPGLRVTLRFLRFTNDPLPHIVSPLAEKENDGLSEIARPSDTGASPKSTAALSACD
jgi:signal transduction histidine kinase